MSTKHWEEDRSYWSPLEISVGDLVFLRHNACITPSLVSFSQEQESYSNKEKNRLGLVLKVISLKERTNTQIPLEKELSARFRVWVFSQGEFFYLSAFDVCRVNQ